MKLKLKPGETILATNSDGAYKVYWLINRARSTPTHRIIYNELKNTYFDATEASEAFGVVIHHSLMFSGKLPLIE